MDNEKCAKKTENVNMAGSKKFVANAKEVKFVTTTNEDQSVVSVVENRFARTICNNQFEEGGIKDILLSSMVYPILLG